MVGRVVWFQVANISSVTELLLPTKNLNLSPVLKKNEFSVEWSVVKINRFCLHINHYLVCHISCKTELDIGQNFKDDD